MENVEQPKLSDNIKKRGSRETIKLPNSDGTWLHCEVKPAEMAEFFVEFCSARGIDSQVAR